MRTRIFLSCDATRVLQRQFLLAKLATSLDSASNESVIFRATSIRVRPERQVKSKVDADDLAQDVLVKAFRSRHSLRDQARVQAWLFRIARRTIIDYYLRQPSTEELEDAAAESDESEEDVVSAAVARAALCFLDTLPENIA